MNKHENIIEKWGVLRIMGMVIGGIIIAAIMGLLLGFFVMILWNWLMPNIFGLTTITFWQAWGLVILTHIFFKSFPHHSSSRHSEQWKEHFKNKFFPEKNTNTDQFTA